MSRNKYEPARGTIRHSAWAITYKNSFCGIGYFGWPAVAHLMRCRTALFNTRREAREAKRTYEHLKRERVVCVTLAITEER